MATVTNGINAVVSFDAAGGTSFTEVATTEGWQTSETRVASPATPSNNSGGQINTAGVRDWSGSFNFLGTDIPLYPGATGKFLGYNGAKSATGLIIVESATFNWDFQGSGNMGGTVNFAANGSLDYVSTTDADATSPNVVNSVGVFRVDWKPVGQGSFATLTGLTGASLTLGRTLAPAWLRENSPWPVRTAGSYTGSVSLNMTESNLEYLEAAANLLTPGTFGIMHLYTSATAYFEIAHIMIGEVQASTAPNQNAEITLPGVLSVGTVVSGSWVEGYVGNPSGTDWIGTSPV